MFFLLNNLPVLLGTTISTDTVWDGAANALYLMNSQINTAMTAATTAASGSSTQQLTEVATGDLAAFTQYT